MNRTNLILLAVFAGVVAIWMANRDWDDEKSSRLAPRMFPELNKEAADRIEMSGGWRGDTITLERVGSVWHVASAGGFEAEAETAEKFIDAVWNLRRENSAGSTAEVQADTRTDEKNGRLVAVFKGDTPVAKFRIGKNPKGFESQFIFIRPEGEDTVYRTRTILTKDQNKEVLPAPSIPGMPPGMNAGGGGARGFDWHTFVFKGTQEWTETKLWELGDLETQELWLTRKDVDAKFKKKGQDEWEVTVGEETHAGDVDAINSLTSQLSWLYHAGIAGRYEDVRGQFGLDQPSATLVMTFRKKIEKKKDEAEPAKEDEEKKDGDEEKKDEEKEKDEYKIVKRTLEVGEKITRPSGWDDKENKVKTEDVYPIRIGGEFEDPALERLAEFVFFVASYRIDPLRKSLEELIQKKEEEDEDGADGDKESEGDKESDDKESDDKESDDKEEKGAEKKDDTPAKDEPKDPKKDEPKDPKKDEGAGEPKEDTPDNPKKDDG